MKNGWQTKKLGELCEIELGKTPARANSAYWDEKCETGNVWLSIADLLKAEDRIVVDSKEYVSDQGAAVCKLVSKGTLLVSFKLTLGRLAFAGRDLFTNEAIAALTILNERELSKEFLFYFLYFFDWVKAAENDVKLKGMTLNKAKLKEMPVHFPLPAEQQRIVGILDEAFEGIATAKANAEENLQNAGALFESHLQSVFTQGGKGWVKTTLEKVLIVQPQNGWSPPAANHSDSGTPVLTLSSVTGFRFRPDKIKFTSASTDSRRNYWVKNGDFLITRSNTPELVGHVAIASKITEPTIYPDLIMRMNCAPDRMITKFLYYQMRSPSMRKEITGRAQGANPTMKKISNGAVKTLPITVPSISSQQAIVEMLDSLSAETQRLANLYERKLAALEALKKSLLHQAFTGELIGTTGKSVAIPFPIQIPNISTTDLHAGILAMAYQLHEQKGQQSYFGHVKAEKIAHMVEASLGIDLGRSPVKDAAGPNDFPHLLKVEHRARMANYFDFKRVDGAAYRVQKLPGFQRLVDKTRTVLGDHHDEVERLLQWMVPMKVQQAEIVATVFAAWNNLLLEGKRPTDEQIVTEARENWHPDKLNIDRPKFLAAVQWLREQGRVPEGKGKRVEGKGK